MCKPFTCRKEHVIAVGIFIVVVSLLLEAALVVATSVAVT